MGEIISLRERDIAHLNNLVTRTLENDSYPESQKYKGFRNTDEYKVNTVQL